MDYLVARYTFNTVMFKLQPALYTKTPGKRPEPSKRIATPHHPAQILPDANVPRKLLPLDPDFVAVRSLEIAAESARAPEDSLVAFDLPALDGGHVQRHGPDGTAEK